MDDSKSEFILILQKTSLNSDAKIRECFIYNICDLKDDELNILIQNFFEKNDCGDVIPMSYRFESAFCGFVFGGENCRASFLMKKDHKEKLKKGIIKFFNFLKNIMVQEFYYHLHFSDGDDDDDNINIVYLIGDIIKNSNNIIKEVYLPNYYLKDNILKILRGYMVNHTSLKYLDFGHSRPKMSNICVEYLDDIIKNSNIENISGLHDNYEYFFENLINNFFRGGSLNLNLYDKNINDDLVLKLSNMIIDKNINYVKEINFSSSIITSKGFTILFDSLLKSKNENIIEIRILNSELGDDCIEKLGELIKQNENISHILLGSNNITDKGIEILSGYIIGNTSIVSINLSHNHGITESSFEIIKNMIKSSTVSSFGIRGIEISEEFLEKIDELLEIPIDKREIPLITNFDVKSASKRMKEEET